MKQGKYGKQYLGDRFIDILCELPRLTEVGASWSMNLTIQVSPSSIRQFLPCMATMPILINFVMHFHHDYVQYHISYTAILVFLDPLGKFYFR